MTSSFVDLQVNGYGGVSFADPSLTADDIARAVQTLRAKGTSAFCPTVVTAAPATYRHVLPLLADACDRFPTSLLGPHLEGPFISPEDGAVGAHPKEHVRPPSVDAFEHLQNLARGRIRILTLAPEVPGAMELIEYATGQGIVVGLAHTRAGEDVIARAVQAGARLSTHLGNGCPQMIHRHDNPIIAQLGSPLSSSIITDGHHLPPAFIRAVFAAKGVEETLVISDSAGIAGLPPGVYETAGAHVRMEPSGRISNLDAPGLAGSSATMLVCMQHITHLCGLSEDAVWRLGRDNPLTMLGLSGDDVDDARNVACASGQPVLLEHE
mgnify:CR=1 FL=1